MFSKCLPLIKVFHILLKLQWYVMLYFNLKFISADIPSYCRSYPGTILPHPTDCAKYFRCPTNKFDTITYQEECTYPDLYSTVSHSCQNFTSVSCGIRQEPQAPCKIYKILKKNHRAKSQRIQSKIKIWTTNR